MRVTRSRSVNAIAITMTLVLAGPIAQSEGGTLDRMRRDIKDRPDDRDDDRSSRRRADDDDDDYDDEPSFLEVLFVQMLGFGVVASIDRVTAPASPEGLRPREAGDALLPVARADATTAWLTEDVQAYSIGGEIGWGPVAITGSYTTLQESNPDDELEIGSVSLALRMSLGSYVGLDLSGGWGDIEGESGFILSLPLRIHPSPYYGFEFRPAWLFVNDTTFDDYRLVAMGGLPFVSVQAGLQIYRTESVDLVGPTVGLTGRF